MLTLIYVTCICMSYVYVCRCWQYYFSISDDGVDDLSGTEAESPATRPFLALLPIKFGVAINTVNVLLLS